MTVPVRFRIVGRGRAGGAIARALAAAGWIELGAIGRGEDPRSAAEGADLVIIATPDAAIGPVASAIEPRPGTVVAHLAGSLGLEVLGGHERRAGIHPLVSLPDAVVGARRLAGGAYFAVAGDPIAQLIVEDLGGRWFEVADADRATYHAAAVIASNHLVGLMGSVERLAAGIGVPTDAYLELARGSLENVAEHGAAAALTGPVARGDRATVERHLAALDPTEVPAYLALAAEAARLAGRSFPDLQPNRDQT